MFARQPGCVSKVLTAFPRARATHHVYVQVVHFLATFCARVDHDAETALRIRVAALLQRQLGCQHHDSTQQRLIGGRDMRHRHHVLFRHDQKVHRCRRMDVMEGEKFIVFIHLLAGNLACRDLAENTVRVVRSVCVVSHQKLNLSLSGYQHRCAIAQALRLGIVHNLQRLAYTHIIAVRLHPAHAFFAPQLKQL